MSKLCRQVSIESPTLRLASGHSIGSSAGGRPAGTPCVTFASSGPADAHNGLVLNVFVPVPETPARGARIRVVMAGACYRRARSASLCSQSSSGAELTDTLLALKQAMLAEAASAGNANIPGGHGGSIAAALDDGGSATGGGTSTAALNHAMRDGALFPGFEVAGVIDELGAEVVDGSFSVGQRVCLYPFEEAPDGYAEFIVVPELRFLIPVPDRLPLSVAAMLPTGALLAMNAVVAARQLMDATESADVASAAAGGLTEPDPFRLLIVGTGGLALWAVRLAVHQFAGQRRPVRLVVASLNDEGFRLARTLDNVTVVQWNEDLYESQLIERTRDACGGPVDVVIDFGTTVRSLQRSLRLLRRQPSACVLLGEELAERLLPKCQGRRFADVLETDDGQPEGTAALLQRVRAVRPGTIEQLHELVALVADGHIRTPPHSVFPFDEAELVVQRLCRSEIHGRAILQFYAIE